MEKNESVNDVLTFAQVYKECTQYKKIGLVRFTYSPVNYKEKRVGYDCWDDYYLCFNYHNEHGRYKCQVPQEVYKEAYVGQPYYLAFLEDNTGCMHLEKIFDGHVDLDETLQQKLAVDVELTGEMLTQEEETERRKLADDQYLAALKFTPEEAAAHKPELIRLNKQAQTYFLAAMIMTVGLFYGRCAQIPLFHSNSPWYMYILYYLLWLCGCARSILKAFATEFQYKELLFRMDTTDKKRIFRVVLLGLLAFANIYLAIFI